MTTFAPRGWTPGMVEKRFANTMPTSYSADDRTVDCVISRGSPVQRFYGTETLRIHRDAVIVDRLIGTGIPLLDSHKQGGIINALGKVTRIWFDDGSLMSKVKFNETPQGRLAEGTVARGELTGISAGYRVEKWEIRDEEWQRHRPREG
jgi:Caudovirus prohead serine protease